MTFLMSGVFLIITKAGEGANKRVYIISKINKASYVLGK
jgi:hypothetical protein